LNDEYVVGKKLGTGSYAVVREAMCKRNNGVFAVKIIDRKQAKEQRLKSEVSEQKPPTSLCAGHEAELPPVGPLEDMHKNLHSSCKHAV
jgi:hypothetical protein